MPEDSPVKMQLSKLATAVSVATLKFPAIEKRCNLAVVALSKIQSIKTDAEDDVAMKVLVKTKEFYELSVAERKEFTGPLDEFKDIAMAPERQINTDAKAPGSEYNRVRNLRNAYAQWKLDEAANKQKKIDDTRKHDEEVNRLKVEFDRNCYESVTTIILGIDDKMHAFFGSITYDTFEQKSAALKAQVPKLKPELYDAMFVIAFDNTKICREEFNILQTEARNSFTYEIVNKDYFDRATPRLNAWIAKLPEKKTALDNLKAIQESNDAAALATAQAVQKAKDDAASEALKKQSEAVATAESASKNDILVAQEQDANTQVMFAAQIATQTISAPAGKKKFQATIISNEEDMVITISELFYKVFIHPKYSGIQKREKTGLPKVDENGRPVYEDWLEKLLDFYANNCETTIKGISLKETISTIQKKETAK